MEFLALELLEVLNIGLGILTMKIVRAIQRRLSDMIEADDPWPARYDFYLNPRRPRS
jgi:hypothetical protein